MPNPGIRRVSSILPGQDFVIPLHPGIPKNESTEINLTKHGAAARLLQHVGVPRGATKGYAGGTRAVAQVGVGAGLGLCGTAVNLTENRNGEPDFGGDAGATLLLRASLETT